jgi:hypothetical protein
MNKWFIITLISNLIFIQGCKKEPDNSIQYPSEATYGQNLLYSEDTNYTVNRGYLENPPDFNVLHAILPSVSSLRIVIESQYYDAWGGPSDQNQTTSGFQLTEDNPDYTGVTSNWELTAIRKGDVEFILGLNKNLTIKIFENGAIAPTYTKEIKVHN